jgi:hypothetical protein
VPDRKIIGDTSTSAAATQSAPRAVAYAAVSTAVADAILFLAADRTIVVCFTPAVQRRRNVLEMRPRW